ncbi:basic helix loop helix (bHLH) DNA-binding superfamily protein, partial [Thalictrum thalictroides]
MEKLCKELDDVKAAMEKLMAENQTKTELSENLRKAHNEQLVKIKEAKLKIEKQAQDLNAKAEEITVLKQMYEETRSDLHEKELALKQARFAHDKLRADDSEKLQALEGKNGELIFALDEANDRIEKQDQRIHTFKDEIERIKGLLSTSQKKARDAEEKAQALKDMRQRDDMLMNLEEENMKTKDQLKWKKEQFKHLQEAHEKVQTQFQTSKKEWEQEKSKILDE